MSETQLVKNYPVFDCDAHINDPLEIWDKYVEADYRDLVKQSYWNTPGRAILNGPKSISTVSQSAARGRTNGFNAG
jgi:hypothetical protein